MKAHRRALPSLVGSDRIIGLLTGILSAAAIGIISLLIHLEANVVSLSEIFFARSLIGLSVTLPLVWRNLANLGQREALAVWVRALAGTVSQFIFAWTLSAHECWSSKYTF